MIKAVSCEQKFQTELQCENDSIQVDVPAARGGTGSGAKPFELLLGGFATCLNITLRMILEKNKIDYKKIIVSVSEDREVKPGTMLISYHVDIDADIDKELKKDFIEKAFSKCPVHNALRGDIDFVYR